MESRIELERCNAGLTITFTTRRTFFPAWRSQLIVPTKAAAPGREMWEGGEEEMLKPGRDPSTEP